MKPFFVRHSLNGMPPTKAERLFGQGFNALFTGDSPVTTVPFRQPLRNKTSPLFDQQAVNDGVRNPTFADFDPRTLSTTQQSVTRHGVQHYMDSNDLMSDTYQSGNQHPVVYTKANGDNVLLSGNHRATAALLKGEMLHAIHVKEPATQQVAAGLTLILQ